MTTKKTPLRTVKPIFIELIDKKSKDKFRKTDNQIKFLMMEQWSRFGIVQKYERGSIENTQEITHSFIANSDDQEPSTSEKMKKLLLRKEGILLKKLKLDIKKLDKQRQELEYLLQGNPSALKKTKTIENLETTIPYEFVNIQKLLSFPKDDLVKSVFETDFNGVNFEEFEEKINRKPLLIPLIGLKSSGFLWGRFGEGVRQNQNGKGKKRSRSRKASEGKAKETQAHVRIAGKTDKPL